MTEAYAAEFTRVWNAMHGTIEPYQNQAGLKSVFDQGIVGLDELGALYQLNRVTAIASDDAEDDYEYNKTGDLTVGAGGLRKLWTTVGKNRAGEDMLLVSLNPKFDQEGIHDPTCMGNYPLRQLRKHQSKAGLNSQRKDRLGTKTAA